MRCSVCGQDYGLTHTCAGVAPAAEETAPPQVGFAPLHYFLEALRIARWDDAAVRRTARDSRALAYGVAVWAMGVALIFSPAVLQLAAAGRRGGAGGYLDWALYRVNASMA